MKYIMNSVALIVFILLTATIPSLSQSARQLNTEGFRLYKKGQYYKALEKFQAAVEADNNYALAHYNLACTHGVLRKKHGPCEHSIGSILFHLKKSVQLDPGRARRMKNDPDLNAVRNTVSYLILSGFDPSNSNHLKRILVQVSWLGPEPGAFGPTCGIKFHAHSTISYWYISFEDPENQLAKKTINGTWRVVGTTIIIKFNKPYNKKRTFKGKLKNGVLEIDGLEGPFSDIPDECSA